RILSRGSWSRDKGPHRSARRVEVNEFLIDDSHGRAGINLRRLKREHGLKNRISDFWSLRERFIDHRAPFRRLRPAPARLVVETRDRIEIEKLFAGLHRRARKY